MLDKVVCAAVRELETGEVWFGMRHSDAIFLMCSFRGEKRIPNEQGFWMVGNGSLGSFVDRHTAGRIALKSGQIRELPEVLHPNDSDLYSEDLW